MRTRHRIVIWRGTNRDCPQAYTSRSAGFSAPRHKKALCRHHLVIIAGTKRCTDHTDVQPLLSLGDGEVRSGATRWL